jgi:hypothetical protein
MARDLITLQEYKDMERISNPKDDYNLDRLINSVSALVKTYCATSFVDFYNVDKVETFHHHWGTNIVQLTETPLVSVSSVEERDNLSSAYTTLTVDKDYYLNLETDSIFRVTSTGGIKNWAEGPASVRVTYRAGYSSTPLDLKLAVIDLVTYYARDEYKERRTLAGATLQNPQSSRQDSSVAFPDHIKRVLDLYKNF